MRMQPNVFPQTILALLISLQSGITSTTIVTDQIITRSWTHLMLDECFHKYVPLKDSFLRGHQLSNFGGEVEDRGRGVPDLVSVHPRVVDLTNMVNVYIGKFG